LEKASILDDTAPFREWSEAQRSAIVDELNRVVSHPTLKGSKRCISLLVYLVNQALAGEEEGTKERTLGVEVFGRNADYDTNSDPIVRRTANEIRKRLGQYYSEPDSHSPVRIHMERGSYIPDFEFRNEQTFSNPIESEIPTHNSENALKSRATSPILESKKPSKRIHLFWSLGLAVIVVVGVAVALLGRFYVFRSPDYRLWDPLLRSGNRIIICVSDVTPKLNGVANGEVPQANPLSHGTPQKSPFVDARVAQEVSTRLLEFNKQSDLEPSSALTFQDFRKGPTVLVGGTINPWSSILLSKLRYTLQIDPVTLDKWVQDSQNPAMRNWKIDGRLNSSDTFDDYAVITRYFDKDSGQWILALSGLEAHGTEAAGELVTDPEFAKSIPSNVKSTGNFQIVIRTPVMRGSTGPFDVLAVYSW